jgi:hypothetical protein
MNTNPQDGARPTVVLVHGGFADGSGRQSVKSPVALEIRTARW